jgi:serine protease Do
MARSIHSTAVTGIIAASVTLGTLWLTNQTPTQWLLADDPPVSLARADELSRAFRSVAQRTLPAIVSIESTGRVRPMVSETDSPFGTDPFDDPLLRQFFGDRLPQLRRQRESVPQRIGQGSGFIIDPAGTIMTNAHVVRGAEEVTVQLSDGREFQATDIRIDERADIAVLKIEASENLPYLPLGDDTQAEIGDWVLAFGSPFGLHRTVTQGIVSAKARGLASTGNRREFIQTDAAINPGNSGGPLVNLRGEVIGINTAISTASGGYDGVGFAVPISVAQWVGDQLLTNGKVKRAYIGVLPQDVDARLAKAMNLDTPRGVLVAEVTPGSPADDAGLKVQDIIVELNGQVIDTSRKLVSVAERLTIGKSYKLKVLREGRPQTLTFTAAAFPEELVARSSSSSAGNAIEVPELGLEVQLLTPTIADQLGLDSSAGVVITSVEPGSFGQRIGLEPGYVILRIGRQDIDSLATLEAALKDAREQGQILLLVKTNSGTQFMSVPFRVER